MCNYLKNNKNLYGLIILDLNMKIDFGHDKEYFRIEADNHNIMRLRLEKYKMDFDRVYITAVVYIRHEKNMDQFYPFFESTSPYYYNTFNVWSP